MRDLWQGPLFLWSSQGKLTFWRTAHTGLKNTVRMLTMMNKWQLSSRPFYFSLSATMRWHHRVATSFTTNSTAVKYIRAIRVFYLSSLFLSICGHQLLLISISNYNCPDIKERIALIINPMLNIFSKLTDEIK